MTAKDKLIDPDVVSKMQHEFEPNPDTSFKQGMYSGYAFGLQDGYKLKLESEIAKEKDESFETCMNCNRQFDINLAGSICPQCFLVDCEEEKDEPKQTANEVFYVCEKKENNFTVWWTGSIYMAEGDLPMWTQNIDNAFRSGSKLEIEKLVGLYSLDGIITEHMYCTDTKWIMDNIATDVLIDEYSDYIKNTWHYKRQFDMIIKAMEEYHNQFKK